MVVKVKDEVPDQNNAFSNFTDAGSGYFSMVNYNIIYGFVFSWDADLTVKVNNRLQEFLIEGLFGRWNCRVVNL